MKDKIYVIIGSVALLLSAFIIGTHFYKKAQKEELSFLAQKRSELFVRTYSPRYGNKEAKVILTEFLDPECESCRKFYPEVKSILNKYEGKVQLVVRYAPFHKNSKLAIAALEAVRKQGKYWEVLEKLFHYQPMWADHHNPKPELMFNYIAEMGIDMERLKTDMQGPEIRNIIQQDLEDLRTLNIKGTPSFFVNGKAPEKFGARFLRELIEKEVNELY